MTEGGGGSLEQAVEAQGFSKEAIGAATSKLISASIGDIAVELGALVLTRLWMFHRSRCATRIATKRFVINLVISY